MSGNVFQHQTWTQRLVFGPGTARTALGTEVDSLEGSRVLLVSTRAEAPLAEELSTGLPVVERFLDVRPHVPGEVADAAIEAARSCEADLVLSIGGGSTTGTAKAVALATGLTILAVPTTYAGSEATPVWGRTEGGRKTTGTDVRVLPRTIVYDAELSRTLPVALGVASGLNALAHCVDSLWAPRANPILDASAAEGIRVLAQALRGILADPDDLGARGDCLTGTYLAAATFAGAGSGLHHKICHVLGGAFDLPHAETHAVVLPHVLAFNADAAPDAVRRVAGALGAQDGTAALVGLYDELGAPRSLKDLGMPEDGLEAVVDQIVAAAPPDNPRPVEAAAVAPAAAPGLGRRATDDRDDGAGRTMSVDDQLAAREAAVTDQVLRSFAGSTTARHREVMESLVQHLHAFARDVRLSEAEWEAGIDFLTRCGHITDDRRQEFILLSDVLGLSMLTVTVNQPEDPSATEATVFGPFFVDGAPEVPLGGDIARGAAGEPCWVEGTVTGTDGSPVPHARLDVWEADDEGMYDVQRPGEVTQGRAHLSTDEHGHYSFWGVTPTPYPIPYDGPVGDLLTASGRGPMRASHLHFMVTAPGYHRLVTHIFVRGDDYLDRDAVFGVKDSLIVDFEQQAPGTPTPTGREVAGTWTTARFDIVLNPEREEQS